MSNLDVEPQSENANLGTHAEQKLPGEIGYNLLGCFRLGTSCKLIDVLARGRCNQPRGLGEPCVGRLSDNNQVWLFLDVA
jgi:hypothetical protein